ncbi:MAG: hypothetical protein WB239_15585 [Acidimicrobiia bacterium]
MKGLDRDDPFELVGASFEVTDAERADTQAARCLVEEFALSGFSAGEVLRLFESPLYSHSHAIYHRRGAGFVQQLIDQVFGGSS